MITSHIGAIGKLVEDMEINMRSLLQDVYFSSAFRSFFVRVASNSS